MSEKWLPVKGYEGHYEVSDKGRIKVVKRRIESSRGDGYSYSWKEKILKPTRLPNGYVRVCLYKDKSRKFLCVHRLVAIAFLPNPENKPQVNHKNGNREDNRLENLEWATSSENLYHKYRVLGCKGKCVTQTPVRCVETGEIFESQLSAAKIKGLSQGNIAHALRGQAHTCGGFHWQYI